MFIRFLYTDLLYYMPVLLQYDCLFFVRYSCNIFVLLHQYLWYLYPMKYSNSEVAAFQMCYVYIPDVLCFFALRIDQINLW